MTATADPRGTDEGPGLTPPAPQVPDPGTAPPLRWGVISPGHIADPCTATAHRPTAPRAPLADMLPPGGIASVYVASPHAQCLALRRPVLEGGVPALVERACTLRAARARDLLGLGDRKGVFVMEAVWARFLPQHGVL